MKILTAALPTLLLLGIVTALSTQSPSKNPEEERASSRTEVLRLERERQAVTDRLEQLRAKEHHVLPRGGLSN